MFTTADLCDDHPAATFVAEPIFRDFGGIIVFAGPITTVQVYEDNTSVRALLETPGGGRVLVVDGGGSLRCALVGDRLAQLALDNGWAGLVIYGCVRDTATLAQLPIGIKALAALPRKSGKGSPGQVEIPVTFAGVTFAPRQYLYADADGIVIAPHALM